MSRRSPPPPFYGARRNSPFLINRLTRRQVEYLAALRQAERDEEGPVPEPPDPPVVLPEVQVQLQANTWQADSNEAASRRVTSGGTLDGSYFAIPSTGAEPDRYFWFSTTDGAGTRGWDPALTDAALTGYTGTQIVLPAGDSTAEEVAAEVVTVLSAVPEYSDVQIADSVVTFRGEVDGDSSFTGTPYADRGPADIWGSRAYNPTLAPVGGEGPINGETIAQYGVGPSEAGARIRYIEIWVADPHDEDDQIRLALYVGGTPTNPAGATLLYDFGQIAGTAIDQWIRIVVPDEVIIEDADADLWVAAKSQLAATNIGGASPNAQYQDFAAQQLWSSTSMSDDPTVPFEATFTAGGSLTINFTIGIRFGYEVPPIRGAGDLVIRWGSHVEATDASLTSVFNFTIWLGSPSPDIEGMFLQSTSVAIGPHNVAQQPRMGFATGGILGDGTSDANGATVLADLGQISGAGTDQFFTVNSPEGVAVPRATLVWVGFKGNFAGGTTAIRFDDGGDLGPNLLSPVTNPMDWLTTDPEYEQPPGAPGTNNDPAVPWPATVFGTTPPAFLPGNYPNVYATFFTLPISVAAVP
jgi:hypothetical protein